MRTYDLTRDSVFLQFLVNSELPLAAGDVSKAMTRLSVWLQIKYRTTATQAKAKAMSRRLLKFSGGSVVTRAPFRVRRPFSEIATS
jgi:hypothetical protein